MQPKGACGEPDASTRRTSGSEGGPGKRTGGNVDTAPRADPYHPNVRLDQAKLCLLVLIGVRTDGRKELVALADGYREATESWADLLRDCKRRGMRAPVLAVGDGALGFWGALREVFPEACGQRCWFHRIANVLAALPKSAHPGAQKALAEIWNAEDKRHALDAVKAFETAAYGAKFPKAVAKIADDVEHLPTLYDFPAEHWIHLRTTNPIVIWRPLGGVLDVRHAGSRSLILRAGRGYLQSSRRQSPRRDDASCTSHLPDFVA